MGGGSESNGHGDTKTSTALGGDASMRTAAMWHIAKIENRMMNPLAATISEGRRYKVEGTRYKVEGTRYKVEGTR